MNTYVRCIFEPNKPIYTQIKRTWPSQPWNHNRWDTAHLCLKLPKNGWGSNYFYDITKAAICKWLKKTMTKNKNKKNQNKIAHCCAKKSSNEKPMAELWLTMKTKLSWTTNENEERATARRCRSWCYKTF